MTDIQSQVSTNTNAYSFSSCKYFCTSCNRQFSQIKVDPTSTTARCPRCNLFCDEVSPSSSRPTAPTQQPRTNTFSQQQGQQNQQQRGGQSYIYVQDAFGRVFLQPVNQGGQGGMEYNQFFGNPFGGFFNFFNSFVPNDEVLIEEFLRNDPNEYGPAPASEEAINKLQQVQYHPEGAEIKCCPVCQEDYHHGENLVRLPCKHEYHNDCVKPWLAKHNSCPMCREQI
jgi:hypothetical protein